MAPEEPRIVLSSSRWAELGTMAFFATCGTVIATSHVHRAEGWYAIAACATFVLVEVAGLIERPRLEVTGGVMTDVGLLRRKSFDLRRCGRFHARQLWTRVARWIITFDYDADGVSSRPVRRSRRRAPNSYVEVHGHDAEEVARVLNQARDRARRTAT